GFGAGEGDFGNRLQGAKQGAEFGTVLGGVIPAGGALAGKTIQGVRDFVSPTLARWKGVGNAADEVLANRLRREGKTPNEIAQYLQEGQDAANSLRSPATLPDTIADTSPGMTTLGSS